MLGTLQNMRLFVAAFEERSFTAAGRRENATQPGISHHIRQLETLFDTPLFIREGSAVRPTAAGEIYYNECIKVLKVYNDAGNAMARYGGRDAKLMRIGVAPAMARCALAPAISEFVEAQPNVSLNIVEGYAPPLAQKVQAGELDFAIATTISDFPRVISTPLFTSPQFIISNGTTGSTRIRDFDVSDTPKIRIAGASSVNPTSANQIDYFRSNGISVETHLQVDSAFGCFDLIQDSDWHATFPACMLKREDADRYLLRRLPNFQFPIILIHGATRELGPIEQAFIDSIVRHAKTFNAIWSFDD